MARIAIRMSTRPFGQAKGMPRGHLERTRRLLHGRVGMCSIPRCHGLAGLGILKATARFGHAKSYRSFHGPVSTSECLRDHLAMLKGCPGANWSGRVEFCTDGLGCARFHRATALLA